MRWRTHCSAAVALRPRFGSSSPARTSLKCDRRFSGCASPPTPRLRNLLGVPWRASAGSIMGLRVASSARNSHTRRPRGVRAAIFPDSARHADAGCSPATSPVAAITLPSTCPRRSVSGAASPSSDSRDPRVSSGRIGFSAPWVAPCLDAPNKRINLTARAHRLS